MPVPDSSSASLGWKQPQRWEATQGTAPGTPQPAGAEPGLTLHGSHMPYVAHPRTLSRSLPGSLSYLHRSNTQDTTPQTYQILAKRLGQISGRKSTAGAGCCKQAGKTFQTGPWSQLFLPVTSVFFKLLHTVVALW